MDLVGTDYRGTFDDICSDKRANEFMALINELKGVDWRVNLDEMTENEIILCTMLEKNMSCEINIKGSMLMYVRSGSVYRQLFKYMAGVYSKYGSR